MPFPKKNFNVKVLHHNQLKFFFKIKKINKLYFCQIIQNIQQLNDLKLFFLSWRADILKLVNHTHSKNNKNNTKPHKFFQTFKFSINCHKLYIKYNNNNKQKEIFKKTKLLNCLKFKFFVG